MAYDRVNTVLAAQESHTTLRIHTWVINCLVQRGLNTGTRAAYGPRTVVVQPANAFSVPYITQSHKYIVLATHPLQVTHHWSAGQYVTIRGQHYPFSIYDGTIANL